MFQQEIETYLNGVDLLRESVAGLTREELLATPVPGRWSTLQVVAHLADFEPIYADRMKRVLAEDRPLLLSGDPDLFFLHLQYHSRDIDEELDLIEATRRHMARMLRSVEPEAFSRVGVHNYSGLITLETLLKNVTGHIPHHVSFINEKRQALGKR